VVAPRPIRRLRLGVSEVFLDQQNGKPWDDVGTLLDSLGDGYTHDHLSRATIH
jgi:hypothetical protein